MQQDPVQEGGHSKGDKRYGEAANKRQNGDKAWDHHGNADGEQAKACSSKDAGAIVNPAVLVDLPLDNFGTGDDEERGGGHDHHNHGKAGHGGQASVGDLREDVGINLGVEVQQADSSDNVGRGHEEHGNQRRDGQLLRLLHRLSKVECERDDAETKHNTTKPVTDPGKAVGGKEIERVRGHLSAGAAIKFVSADPVAGDNEHRKSEDNQAQATESRKVGHVVHDAKGYQKEGKKDAVRKDVLRGEGRAFRKSQDGHFVRNDDPHEKDE